LLHIFDSSDWRIIQTAETRNVYARLPIPDGDSFCPALDGLVQSCGADGGPPFDRILFETHGTPGRIYFGNNYIDGNFLRACVPRNYTNLTTRDARIYFNGCNIAEGSAGWDFLYAAAALFVTPGGGQVFGQTSTGFGNPFNGHVVHLWGTTRTLFVAYDGSITEQFEQ